MQDAIAEEQFPVRLKSHQERNYSPHPCGSPFGPAELFKIVPINFSGHPQDGPQADRQLLLQCLHTLLPCK